MINRFKLIPLIPILFLFACTKTTQEASIPSGETSTSSASVSTKIDNKDVRVSGKTKNYNSTLTEYQTSETNSQKLLNNFSSLDIAGLKLGMSRDDVVSSLKKYKENFKFKYNNDKLNLPESHEYLNSISAESISREEFLKSYGEFFTVSFYSPPNKNLVSKIQRETKFAQGDKPTFEALLKFLKDKYGSPKISEHCYGYGICELIWKYKYSPSLDHSYNIQYDENFDRESFMNTYKCEDSYIKTHILLEKSTFFCGKRLSVKITFYFDEKSMLKLVDSISFEYYDELNLRLAAEYTRNFTSTVQKLNTDLEADLLKGNIGTPSFK
jgi:hypothetical protein